MTIVLTTFTLIWILFTCVGVGVYVWDWREARLDGDFLNQPPPGMTERRVRPQSHMIVQGDVTAAGLYLVGQVAALVVGGLSLWTPAPSSSRGLTTRGLVLIIGFILLEGFTSAGGVVRIYVRRWLRRRHAAEIETAAAASDLHLDKELQP
jgi:hypothetical protein